MNASALSISLTAVLTLSALSCKRSASTSVASASPPTPAPAAPAALEPVIVGTVIDSFGHPIQGATLSIRDSAFRAATNEQGEFSLTFAPGSFRVTAEAPGCLPHSRDLQLTQAVRYPLGPTMLVRIPDLPRETVVVATEQGYRPLPATELERRVINFGSVYAAFPGRCAVFSLQRDVPILRGSVLFVVSPDEHFQLVRVEDLHVTTDSYPGSVGQCPGVPQGARVVATRKGTMPERTFFLSTLSTTPIRLAPQAKNRGVSRAETGPGSRFPHDAPCHSLTPRITTGSLRERADPPPPRTLPMPAGATAVQAPTANPSRSVLW